MVSNTEITEAADTAEAAEAETREAAGTSDLFALEACFLAFLGLAVLAAFVEAFSYQIVSSRTPFVIMVPLLALIAVQARRLMAAGSRHRVRDRIALALNRSTPAFGKVLAMQGWLALLLLLIVLGGHYVGIAAFMFLLMRVAAKERLVLALAVTAATTALIFVLFEYGFDIELYRGMIFRYFAGYRVF